MKWIIFSLLVLISIIVSMIVYHNTHNHFYTKTKVINKYTYRKLTYNMTIEIFELGSVYCANTDSGQVEIDEDVFDTLKGGEFIPYKRYCIK